MKKHLLGCVALTALAVACSSGGTTDAGSGGTTGSGSTNGTSGGSSGSSTTTFCDGLGVQDSSGSNTIFLQYYGFTGELKTEGCDAKVSGWADGQSVPTIGGIWDVDTSDNGGSAPAPALFVANCGDVGQSGNPVIADSYTAPAADAGLLTVAEAVAAQNGAGFWGVVTASYPWTLSGTSAKSGTIYVQDPVADGGTPANNSGIQLYMHEGGSANIQNDYGYAPAVGDVITVTNIKWSAYKGGNQFEGQAGTKLAKIGTSPLPPAVQVTPAQVNNTAAIISPFEGMIVTVSGGPFTAKGTNASGDCPPPLEYIKSASGG